MHGLFLKANRIVFLGTRGNQVAAARGAGAGSTSSVTWRRALIAAGILVVVIELKTAALLYRAGQPVAAVLACALTGLLVSPLSWDHHWVWVAPGIALLAHLGARARGAVRAWWWAAGAGLLLVFGAWPQFWDLAQAGLTPAGLFWYGPATYFARGETPPWLPRVPLARLAVAGREQLRALASLVALAALAAAAFRLRNRRASP